MVLKYYQQISVSKEFNDGFQVTNAVLDYCNQNLKQLTV